MRVCCFDNRWRKPIIVIPEKFFKGTSIPSWGWILVHIQTVDNDATYPYRTWAKTKEGEDIEVSIALPTVAIEPRKYRFYSFRVTKKDILKKVFFDALKENLSRGSILAQLKAAANKSFSEMAEIETAEYEDCVWISLKEKVEKTYTHNEVEARSRDKDLLKRAEQVKIFIETWKK